MVFGASEDQARSLGGWYVIAFVSMLLTLHAPVVCERRLTQEYSARSPRVYDVTVIAQFVRSVRVQCLFNCTWLLVLTARWDVRDRACCKLVAADYGEYSVHTKCNKASQSSFCIVTVWGRCRWRVGRADDFLHCRWRTPPDVGTATLSTRIYATNVHAYVCVLAIASTFGLILILSKTLDCGLTHETSFI